MSQPLWRSYYRLTKPGIFRMVMVTAALGYFMASKGMPIHWLRFLGSMVGIGMAAAGSAVLNNYLERDHDLRMERTKGRELPAGIIPPANALVFGIVLTLVSMAILVMSVTSLLTPFIVLLTSFLYVLVYTPLKRRTWLNTSIGAIPGALPILCGWTAAVDHADFTAWVLFALMFAWQHPHFYAIAFIYKEDYRRAGFRMLSVVDEDGRRLFLQVILYSLMLLAVSIVPWVIGKSGTIYLAAALSLGVYSLSKSIQFVRNANMPSARALLKATILYLPLLALAVGADVLFLDILRNHFPHLYSLTVRV
jgi:protoheme IX farnesyltransferase